MRGVAREWTGCRHQSYPLPPRSDWFDISERLRNRAGWADIDDDGFWWSATSSFLAVNAPTDWYRYLRIEATLRKAFGTVLNHDYNAAHHDHWHCDLGRSTAWRAVTSQAKFAQRALNEIWKESLAVDGDWGTLSSGAATRHGYDFASSGAWDRFLDSIINQQSTMTQGRRSVAVSLADSASDTASLEEVSVGETTDAAKAIGQVEVFGQTKVYEDPNNFPINLPEPGSGQDRFDVAVPDGLQLAHIDIEYLEQSPLASVEVVSGPKRGATGAQTIVLKWSHPPYGKIGYRVRVFASRTGDSAPTLLVENSTGFNDRMRLLLDQQAPVAVLVTGTRAKLVYEGIQRAQKDQPQARTTAACMGACIAAIVAVVIVLVIAVVVVLGFFVFRGAAEQGDGRGLRHRGHEIQDDRRRGPKQARARVAFQSQETAGRARGRLNPRRCLEAIN